MNASPDGTPASILSPSTGPADHDERDTDADAPAGTDHNGAQGVQTTETLSQKSRKSRKGVDDDKLWYADWFQSPWYLELYSHRNADEAKSVIRLVEKSTSVRVGDKVLDLCCGTGRHALTLARHGYQVTGIDYSPFFIERANRTNTFGNLRYHVGDMRAPYPDAPFKCVCHFFTSFGYFDDDADNFIVFQRVSESLEPNGWYFFDFLNQGYLRSNLQPLTDRVVKGARIIEKRHIEQGESVDSVVKDISIVVGVDGINTQASTHSYSERVKLYDSETLTRELGKVGLQREAIFGGYHGEPYDAESSKRLIIVARKN